MLAFYQVSTVYSKSRIGICSMLSWFYILHLQIIHPAVLTLRRPDRAFLTHAQGLNVHRRRNSTYVPADQTYSMPPQFSSEYYTSHRSFTKHDNKILITAAALCQRIYILLRRGFPRRSLFPRPLASRLHPPTGKLRFLLNGLTLWWKRLGSLWVCARNVTDGLSHRSDGVNRSVGGWLMEQYSARGKEWMRNCDW